jgi:serine protease Do
MKKIIPGFSFALFLFLSGCPAQDVRSPEIKPLKEVIVKDINELVDNGRLMQALQYLVVLENEEGKIPKDQILKMKDDVIARIGTSFNQTMGKGDFDAALKIFISMKNIGREGALTGWTMQKLLLAKAESLRSKKNLVQALLIAIQAAEQGSLTAEEWKKTLGLVLETRNGPALQYLKTLADKQKAGFDELKQAPAIPKPQLKDMMKGTVTVWVDKGMKLERGIGFPDRILGSGFFIDPRGYILTNHHVIVSEVDPEYEGFSRLYIRLPGKEGDKVPARVVGYDRIFDIALLKAEVTPEFWFSIPYNVPLPELGEKVYAIGSPLDPILENTITSGIVSSIGRRKFLQNGDVMQIDAPVNPGNSGGPLLDDEGDVLGVVFAGIQSFQGLNFAIPFGWIMKVLPALYGGNEIVHSWLGLALLETEGGLEVMYTVPSGPAQLAGIQAGDHLTAINGKSPKSIMDMQSEVLSFRPDTLVRVSWTTAEGTARESVCNLAERPFSPIEYALDHDERNRVFLPLFGLEIKVVDNILWETTFMVKRVIKGSVADNTGLSVGDPLNIQNWIVDPQNRVAALQLFVKKKQEGFFESIISLVNSLEQDFFL